MEFKKLGRSKVEISALGLGTWGIGGFSSRHLGGDEDAVQALRLGLELGMRFIDTAEMYASGHSEEVVARTVGEEREKVFIATKVSAENLSYDRVVACMQVQPQAFENELHRSLSDPLAEPANPNRRNNEGHGEVSGRGKSAECRCQQLLCETNS